MNDHPIRLKVGEDLRRSRLTVFFRLILAIPLFVWLSIWGIVAAIAVIANWFATLFAGQSPRLLHDFLAAYLRFAIHLYAYLLLAADRYPDFLGKRGYPIDVAIAPPASQNRWKVFFRLILAIPAILLAAALTVGRSYGLNYSLGLAGIAAFLGWFAVLATGRMPRGLRDVVAYALSYSAQLDAYLFLLTDRYPNSDPQLALPELPTRSDPIGLDVLDRLRRNRLTAFFRLFLAIPYVIWLVLWEIVALLAAIANWFVTLAGGVSPASLHNFLAAYVRYRTHVYAFLFLIADPFPAFTGKAGSYPVDPAVAPPVPQNRWKIGFRIVLAIPALMVSSAYGGLLLVVAVLGWFAILATGSMPQGLRNAGAQALRYAAQLAGYLAVITDAYPYSGPISAPGSEPATAIPQPFAEPVL